LEEAKSPEIKAKEVKAKKLKSQEDDEKAELKKPSKQVEEDQENIYDQKDDKNLDNLIFDQVMTGYYAEMKDPKNADKTMEQLKDIVLKNLSKDPIFYTKDGQFGVKGLGYTTEAPGLGTPKEAKGKYKASGYGDLKEGVEFISKNSPPWVHQIFNSKEYIEITPQTKLEKGDQLIAINNGIFYEIFKDNGAKVIIIDDAYGDKSTRSREKIENFYLIKKKSTMENLYGDLKEGQVDMNKSYPKIHNPGTKITYNGKSGTITGNFMVGGEEFASYKVKFDDGTTDEISTADKNIKFLEESLEEQKIRKAIRTIVSEELNSEAIGKNYPDKISGEYEGKSVLFPGVDLYNLLKDILEIAISEDDFVNKIAYALTDETSTLLPQDEHKLRTWYEKNNGASIDEANQLVNINTLISKVVEVKDLSLLNLLSLT
jgi:hypothetical protein